MIVAEALGKTIEGEIDKSAGVRLVTLTVTAVEVPPPGEEFWAVIVACELPVKFAAGTVAFTSDALTNVVGSAVVFHAITDPEINPVPLISSTLSPDPAGNDAGLIWLMTGTGLFTGRFIGAADPPPGGGLTTTNWVSIPLVSMLAGIVALRLVGEL